MIKAIIGGELVFPSLDPATRKALKKALELPNPAYQVAIRTNPRAKYALSPFIRYWKELSDGTLIVPRGVLDRLKTYAEKTGQELDLKDEQTKAFILEDRAPARIDLRAYQQGVAEHILVDSEGVAELGTAWGKTILGCQLIDKLKQKTLIIVPKIDLANQWEREVKRFLPDYSVGVISGKQMSIGDVTIATMQTLSRRVAADIMKKDEFGMIIADECHGFVSEIARKTIGHFTAKYRYGLTATCRRTDEQGEAIHFLFGPTLVKRELPRSAPHVVVVRNEEHIWADEYAQMIEAQTQSAPRNQLIVKVINAEIANGRRILVLTKRVEHYKVLQEMLNHQEAYCLSSDMKRQEREELLTRLQVEPFSVLFGTFPLLGTGISIPSLDTLVIAGDLKSDVLVTQSAGRILRLFEGKQSPRIIDIHDVNNGILKRQGNLRQKFYRENNWQIIPYET